MQSDDDFSSGKVQAKLKAKYSTVAKSLTDRSVEFPNFASVSQMVDRKEISYKELLMLNDLIPNLCDDGLRKLEQTFQ